MNKGRFTYILAIAALLTLVAAVACIRGGDREYGGRGEVIHVGAHKPVKLDRVVYALPRYCEEAEDAQMAEISRSWTPSPRSTPPQAGQAGRTATTG